jgi:hypothetical protein
MSTAEQKEPKPKGSIWYATRSDPLLAFQPVIWLKPPEGEVALLEPMLDADGEPDSPVSGVLAAAGFIEGATQKFSLNRMDDERHCVRHYGFDVPEGQWSQVEQKIHKYLEGELGGWTEVLTAQTSYHGPSYMTHIFGVLWTAAGEPKMHISHHLPPAPGKSMSNIPSEILPFGPKDPRIQQAFERFKNLGQSDHDSLTPQKTYRQWQKPVEISPEVCAVCGGRMYKDDGHVWCAKAAQDPGIPDPIEIDAAIGSNATDGFQDETAFPTDPPGIDA